MKKTRILRCIAIFLLSIIYVSLAKRDEAQHQPRHHNESASANKKNCPQQQLFTELPQDCNGFQLVQDSTSARDVITDALLHSNIALADLIQKHNVTSTRQSNSFYSHPKRYLFQYSLYNWKESGVAKVRFHDTDMLLSTSTDGKELIIAFGGTASVGDLSTNLQTFESANHSSFFQGDGIEGSLHRGFLNAYSRVDEGYILPLGNNVSHSIPLLRDIHGLFTECEERVRRKTKTATPRISGMMLTSEIYESSSKVKRNNTSSTHNDKELRNRGCHLKRIKLSDILRQLVIDALEQGITVHVTGHSLGGALATLLAGDVIVNHPSVSVKKLNVWVYGSPQIADDTFLRSAIDVAPRLKKFLKGNGRFNRFVTLSNRCKVDAIVDVTKVALSERKKWGGVHGSVVHFAEPRYLLTDAQSSAAAHELDHYIESLAAATSKNQLAIDIPSLDLSQCVRKSQRSKIVANHS
ncbi:hypothetical protein ACHAWT_002621 [Skeletonema menzelii]